MYTIGIDLGGTKIAAGLIDADHHLVSIHTVKTELANGAEGVVTSIKNCVDQLLCDTDCTMDQIAYAGAGVPGTANLETGRIEYANNLGFYNVPFEQMLRDSLGVPVYFDNDANCAAWGEYMGASHTSDSFVMVTLGTGVGGGIILNHKIHRGTNFAAAELGHMVIDLNGRECNCGRRGCLEAYASVTALNESTIALMQKTKDSMLWELCKQDTSLIDGKKIFAAYARKDAIAVHAVSEYITYLSIGIANIINILQPEELCIGGGISKAAQYYIDEVRTQTKQMIYSRNSMKNTIIAPAVLGNEAGILGAGLLGENH